MKKKQVVIIHGGEVFQTYEEYIKFLKRLEIDPYKKPFKDWKSTLQEKLGNRYEVIYPSFPNKLNAKYEEWEIWFDKYVPYFRNGVIFIGHSLGGSFITKYLSEHKLPVSVNKLFLVATPGTKVFTFNPELDKELKTKIEHIYTYFSDDDEVVSLKDALHITNSVIRRFKKRGHFLQKNLPEIVKDIKE